ncbi:hypothetical protein BURPS406E_G0050 [Burkholderia pseudomallei 406e]|uniref:Uncharacterized protein n=2 Tax=Burkholderia pseudomallei TaxID=28450 RepID=A0A0E1VYV7_BURPE|nr:hypothetical protein BURPS1106A_A0889 [Burkholderia pseudomallei 1106a]EDO87451.1 hypothetical protein BURPS406E_G0050 [Burkholderia pseudomallei 406e]EDS82279.1 hypothetical protein BURPSS13_T0023 [Burkholderia pseudomallei S13]EDU10597.1 hypothetical protein BURPS1655_I0143 [Burkholderia pseudomallei 1655]EEC38439.1 conserved hypothetical protein [Burkholderia pseudomallei 576]EEH28745.1 conserved hypothetical protein [Burkholderia pseudomallei Pakistan 9]EES21854.1 hypothetical protein 
MLSKSKCDENFVIAFLSMMAVAVTSVSQGFLIFGHLEIYKL